jgi:hypothetical protein
VGKRTIPVPAVFNHEPGATTSRFARLTRSPLPLAQSLPALARVIVVRANPVPRGCVVAPVTKARKRDTKTSAPCRRWHENAVAALSSEPVGVKGLSI